MKPSRSLSSGRKRSIPVSVGVRRPTRVDHVAMEPPAPVDSLPDHYELAAVGHGAAIGNELVGPDLVGGVALDLELEGAEVQPLDPAVYDGLEEALDGVPAGEEIGIGCEEPAILRVKRGGGRGAAESPVPSTGESSSADDSGRQS